jgi:hypothetical protein
MHKYREGIQKTVPEILQGVAVPEIGHLDGHAPTALLLLKDQIRRTIERLVKVDTDRDQLPVVRNQNGNE